MSRRNLMAILVGLSIVGVTQTATAAVAGLERGNIELKSAGPLAFGPEGVLLVGDPKSAAVYAIETVPGEDSASNKLQIDKLGEKISSAFGAQAEGVAIKDLAVNPADKTIYLSVELGEGDSAQAGIVRISSTGELSQFPLKNVRFAKAQLSNAPEDRVVQRGRRRSNPRQQSITDIAFSDGQVIVSGLSASDAPSTVRVLAFPFVEADSGTSLEIFHGAHGRSEDYAAVKTLIPFNIGGEPHVLAAYTCTPLVSFPLSDLRASDKVSGKTLAELGNRNTPLDMIAYSKDGQEFILMANDRRGVMKISTENIGEQEGITSRVEGTAGLEYDTIDSLQGVIQLDRWGEDNDMAVVVIEKDAGGMTLQTVELP